MHTANTPVPTANRGWVLAENIQKGDIVFDALGQRQTVTETFPVRHCKCVSVMLDDGRCIDISYDQRLPLRMPGSKPENESLDEDTFLVVERDIRELLSVEPGKTQFMLPGPPEVQYLETARPWPYTETGLFTLGILVRLAAPRLQFSKPTEPYELHIPVSINGSRRRALLEVLSSVGTLKQRDADTYAFEQSHAGIPVLDKLDAAMELYKSFGVEFEPRFTFYRSLPETIRSGPLTMRQDFVLGYMLQIAGYDAQPATLQSQGQWERQLVRQVRDLAVSVGWQTKLSMDRNGVMSLSMTTLEPAPSPCIDSLLPKAGTEPMTGFVVTGHTQTYLIGSYVPVCVE